MIFAALKNSLVLMKKVIIVVLSIFVFACGKKEADLVVKVHVKGLQKGVVYLKKLKDSALVTVDSAVVSGNQIIQLYSAIESPEMFFLDLDKNSSEEERISFFADKGITEINTTLKNFAFDAKIKGSKQQKILEDYKAVVSRMNNDNLELIKENFEAQKSGDTVKLKAIEKQSQGNLRRKYLFTVNYALNNKDSEVAPYLALSEIYNARVNLLDTINESLTPKVKQSKYGKELQSFIDKVKATE